LGRRHRLSATAIIVYQDIKHRLRETKTSGTRPMTTNNGRIHYSVNEAMAALETKSRSLAQDAIDKLQAAGFIVPTNKRRVQFQTHPGDTPEHEAHIRRHKYLMIALYGLGLIVAGGFTLAPGRVMHAALFGGPFH
jgi:SOS-response transcriptional repressor LexA